MSEAALMSVGRALREAREARGIALDDVAARLRLMQRQIEAMEADDFESLGQPVFARGFVRNYARLLNLDPDALLSRMQGAPAEPAVVSQAEPQPQRSWLSSPWLILLLLGVLVLLAVPVGLYWWLNSEVDEATPGRVAAVSPRPAAVAPHPVAPPVAAPPAPPAATPEQPAAVEPAAVPADAAAEPAVAPGAVAANAPASVPPAGPGGALHIEFGEESWVEIKDASGRLLLRQLKPAGSSADVRGQPPFDLVIGNAAQARMTYNGRPIDLKPFIDVTVARFTLEE